jgi:GlpG protein
MIVCGAIFVLLNTLPEPSRSSLMGALAPRASSIWAGAVWGLVSTAFVHLQIWHVAFNMFWARDLGRVVEPDLGRGRFLGLIVASAAVSSGWELLVGGSTGIGFSGVVYAIFGYVVARRRSRPTYGAIVTRRNVQWMLGWLVLCIVLTVAKVWNVGNAAHLSGLAFGWLLGVAVEKRNLRAIGIGGLAALGAGTVASVAYMPWSPSWIGRAWLREFDALGARAEAGDKHAAWAYGSTMMHWPERRSDGMKWLRAAAEGGDVDGMNGLAWWEATAKEDSLRNAAESVQWASRAVAANHAAWYKDTLAAAYAESDRWDEALETERQALADSESDPALAAKPKLLAEMKEHLERFERRQKLRE